MTASLSEDDLLDIVNVLQAVLEHTLKYIPEEQVEKAFAHDYLRKTFGEFVVTSVGEALLAGFETGRSIRASELDLLKAQWRRDQKT